MRDLSDIAPAMVRLLVHLEWIDHYDAATCPICDAFKSSGNHEPTCEMARVLQLISNPLSDECQD